MDIGSAQADKQLIAETISTSWKNKRIKYLGILISNVQAPLCSKTVVIKQSKHDLKNWSKYLLVELNYLHKDENITKIPFYNYDTSAVSKTSCAKSNSTTV